MQGRFDARTALDSKCCFHATNAEFPLQGGAETLNVRLSSGEIPPESGPWHRDVRSHRFSSKNLAVLLRRNSAISTVPSNRINACKTEHFC